MATTPADLVRTYAQRHRFTFELVEEGSGPSAVATLIERASGKTLRFAWGALESGEEATDQVHGGRYLRLLLDDGRAFAMAGIGIVFAPSFMSTGKLPDCPASASFADFEKLFHHLDHLVGEADTGRGREALQVLMILIAFVDGARQLGLEVGPEEQRLEAQLKRLEERGIPLR